MVEEAMLPRISTWSRPHAANGRPAGPPSVKGILIKDAVTAGDKDVDHTTRR